MVLGNFVELVEGRATRLHCTRSQFVTKTVVDPLLGREKSLRTLVLDVDELDGGPVAKLFSITSEKLAANFAPYLAADSLPRYVFTITPHGQGYTRTYEVGVTLRSP